MFELIKSDGLARRGRLQTLHGTIETPIFMPVGTQATVKGVTPEQLKSLDAQIILANTYHLNLRPGPERIRAFGGLHRFMGWDRPILTDSGGFQVFSLSKLRKIGDDGITFRSHLDGRSIYLDPKTCYEIQSCLGSDIAMVLDECPPFPCAEKKCHEAVERSLRWAKSFLQYARDDGFLDKGHAVFGIVQGSTYDNLRLECAQRLAAMDFPGYAVGGVSVGEPEEEMLKQVAASAPGMPTDKPRYVMGVGTPPQLLKMIALGMDMFDCVMPTRLARHGVAFTLNGTINLRNERFKDDQGPLDPNFDNYTCRHFSRGYIRHLLQAKELLAATLLSIHNLDFFLRLMEQAREAIETGNFSSWSRNWIESYTTTESTQ